MYRACKPGTSYPSYRLWQARTCRPSRWADDPVHFADNTVIAYSRPLIVVNFTLRAGSHMACNPVKAGVGSPRPAVGLACRTGQSRRPEAAAFVTWRFTAGPAAAARPPAALDHARELELLDPSNAEIHTLVTQTVKQLSRQTRCCSLRGRKRRCFDPMSCPSWLV
jgi:hypothetical protein